jgi:RNA polymerase sigma-70 factor, ECF subfamily
MENALDEATLIAQAQRGDTQAYESLVRQYEQIAFRAAYLITHDEHEAADAAQDAFVRAYRALKSFKTDQPFRPWLLRIVTNQALNRLKSAQRRTRLTGRLTQEMMTNQDAPSAERAAEAREQNERLLQAVQRLGPDEQTLIALRYFLELPEREVAQTLGVPLGTVKSRLHRTLARLREIITRDFPDLKEAGLTQ